jgi:phosphogluconate dehydratase
MLSAHTPMQRYRPHQKTKAGRYSSGGGGMPAMCDGVTQGTEGMELSLFSRDVIAMATAVALSHDMFDAALMLGVCDKIVLLIGALHFGHLTVFVPAGLMPTGMGNKKRHRCANKPHRGWWADGLLASEMKLPRPALARFMARQQQPDAAGSHGLQVPGTAFVAPGARCG